MSTQCCFDVGPASTTLAQHQNNMRSVSNIRWAPTTSTPLPASELKKKQLSTNWGYPLESEHFQFKFYLIQVLYIC